MLPYFRKIDKHHIPSGDHEQHGFEGPISTTGVLVSGRKYPLQEMVRQSWEEVGVKEINDINGGSPLGLGEVVDNRKDGERQLASELYPLDGVRVMDETLVKKVLIQERDGKKVGVGVQLADGRILKAQMEIIVSAGAYRTAQILMLSGIGDEEVLSKHGITQIVDLPEVGKNLHDHLALNLWWKLRYPERGYSVDSPLFNDPTFFKGSPVNWAATQAVPHSGLKAALEFDTNIRIPDDHPLLQPPRSHTESLLVYLGINPSNPTIQLDGTHVFID